MSSETTGTASNSLAGRLRLNPCRKYSQFIGSDEVKTRHNHSRDHGVMIVVLAGQSGSGQSVANPAAHGP